MPSRDYPQLDPAIRLTMRVNFSLFHNYTNTAILFLPIVRSWKYCRRYMWVRIDCDISLDDLRHEVLV